MLLNLSDLSPEPLHAQITRQIRAKILGGELTEGTQLPSIRKMAAEQKVSVITVQRSYEDLDKEDLINSRRGKGFTVAELTSRQKKMLAVNRLKENLEPVIKDAKDAGMVSAQIEEVVRDLLSGKVKKK